MSKIKIIELNFLVFVHQRCLSVNFNPTFGIKLSPEVASIGTKSGALKWCLKPDWTEISVFEARGIVFSRTAIVQSPSRVTLPFTFPPCNLSTVTMRGWASFDDSCRSVHETLFKTATMASVIWSVPLIAYPLAFRCNLSCPLWLCPPYPRNKSWI